ncbi:YqaA family protein [Lichenibacterium dinghuense]|uniref:YqaA family protein n=1 Tax=Lichenibacterium dinghuense TaxID=2895977 RepID=UPI001F3DA7D0|nr:YqaA family protein [Lichenibacterium sp. 6Y81]
MFDGIYRWTLRLSESRHAPLALGAVAFAESSFFPIPPDLILVPMALARPQRAWAYATICTAASVLGGMVGYTIGALLYDTVGQWLIATYHYADKMEAMRAAYAQWGWLLILIKGLTPIPYKLVTIVSGLLGYNFALFVLLSVITRGARFFILAGLLNRFGDPIRGALERHFASILVGFLLLVGIGFYVATHAI